jgi:hypothetical protein
VAWVVKGGAILAGEPQPALVLEVGLACFGVALLLLAVSAGSRVALGLGVVSTAAGTFSLGVEVAGRTADPVIAVAALSLLVGLVLLSPRDQPGGWVPRGIGLATLPVLGVGGVLALVDEALLEVSTVALGLAWTWLGVRLWRAREASYDGVPVRRAGRPASP